MRAGPPTPRAAARILSSMKDNEMQPSSTMLKLILIVLMMAAIAGMLGWFSPAGAQSALASI